MTEARNEDYWTGLSAAEPHLRDWQLRRRRRMAVELYGAFCAYSASDATPENPPSVPTCERSPIFERNAEPAALDRDLSRAERAAIPLLFRMGVEEIDRAVQLVAGGGRRLDAIHAAFDRDRDRQWKVLALLDRGEVGRAYRLAACGRRAVQLECPEHAGGCGCRENYVPTHCDLRCCPDCQERKTGQNIEKYRDAVFEMDRPTFMTFTVENVEDPVGGRDRMVDDLSDLRRRTIPFEGEVERETDDGEIVTKSWSWWEGVGVEDIDEDHTQWKLKLQEDGEHDLVRRLQKQYVNYEYENPIAGRVVGRNIPFTELVDGGLYGIDVKQKGPFEFNVHAHVLVDAAYIPQAALSAVWEDLTGDPVVDVRRIYDRSSRESVVEVLAETVGYAVKPPEFEDLEDELAFVEASKGCPMVHPFGSLHGAGTQDASLLLCSRCEQTPTTWEYLGVVDERRDTMGKGWDTKGECDPPVSDEEG